MTRERMPVERLAAAVRGRFRLLWGGLAVLSLLALLLGGGDVARADTTTVTVQVPVTRYEYRQTGSHQEQRLAGGRWEWQRTLDGLRPPAGYGMGNAWLVGDLTGDGRLDAVHLCCPDYLRAWVQQADGSFSIGSIQRPWSGYPMQGGVWEVVDWNGDGRQDLRHYVNGRRYDWRSLGNGSFQVTDGGALPAPNVAMNVDSPAGGSRVSQALWINGWALDRSAPGGAGCGIDDVHVWAYPSDGSGNPTGSPVFLGAAVLGRDRADVASVYGQQFGYCGFDLRAGGLSEGYWLIVVYAHSALSSGGPWAEQRRVVWVKGASWASDSWNHPGGVRMWVDRPTRGSMTDQPFTVEGWALDLASCCNAGIQYVHVWAYPAREDGMPNGDPPVFVGTAQLGLYRPDVGNVYGRQYDYSGFRLDTGPSLFTLRPGYYRLVAYARGISGNVGEYQTSVFVRTPRSMGVTGARPLLYARDLDGDGDYELASYVLAGVFRERREWESWTSCNGQPDCMVWAPVETRMERQLVGGHWEWRQTGTTTQTRVVGQRDVWTFQGYQTVTRPGALGTVLEDSLSAPWGSYSMTAGTWLMGDFNGDGRRDLFHICCADYGHSWLARASGGYQVSGAQRPWSGYPMQAGVWRVADINGDGRQDLQHWASGRRYDWYSLGDGRFLVQDAGAATAPGNLPPRYYARDLNGNGLYELVSYTRSSHGVIALASQTVQWSAYTWREGRLTAPSVVPVTGYSEFRTAIDWPSWARGDWYTPDLNGPIHYYVGSGDSFSIIAAFFMGDQGRACDIASYNGLPCNAVLYPGQRLLIPVPAYQAPMGCPDPNNGYHFYACPDMGEVRRTENPGGNTLHQWERITRIYRLVPGGQWCYSYVEVHYHHATPDRNRLEWTWQTAQLPRRGNVYSQSTGSDSRPVDVNETTWAAQVPVWGWTRQNVSDTVTVPQFSWVWVEDYADVPVTVWGWVNFRYLTGNGNPPGQPYGGVVRTRWEEWAWQPALDYRQENFHQLVFIPEYTTVTVPDFGWVAVTSWELRTMEVPASVIPDDWSFSMNPGIGLTGLATWFWATGSARQDYYSQATYTYVDYNGQQRTAPVQFWARPAQYIWSFGDGRTLTTTSPGQAYPTPSDVRHTYERSSLQQPGQAYTVGLTVGWDLYYRYQRPDGSWPDWQYIGRVNRGPKTAPYPVQQVQGVLTQ